MINVTVGDALAYCEWLGRETGKTIRLPEENEWEFAARGGKKGRGYAYSGSNNSDEVAWYVDNSGGSTHEVATKKPNELGLYDMSGNVSERCGKQEARAGGPIGGAQTICVACPIASMTNPEIGTTLSGSVSSGQSKMLCFCISSKGQIPEISGMRRDELRGFRWTTGV